MRCTCWVKPSSEPSRCFVESVAIRNKIRYDSPVTISERQDELLEELNLFQDWTERYEYIIGLGKKLPPMDQSLQTEDHLIKGCQSQVWLDASLVDGKMLYLADSDSLITKGMIALFIRILNGQTAQDVLSTELTFIEKTGLKEHLAPTRANALTLMAAQMRKCALEAS